MYVQLNQFVLCEKCNTAKGYGKCKAIAYNCTEICTAIFHHENFERQYYLTYNYSVSNQ